MFIRLAPVLKFSFCWLMTYYLLMGRVPIVSRFILKAFEAATAAAMVAVAAVVVSAAAVASFL